MEIITNFLRTTFETSNGEVMAVVLSSIILGLVLGLVAQEMRNRR